MKARFERAWLAVLSIAAASATVLACSAGGATGVAENDGAGGRPPASPPPSAVSVASGPMHGAAIALSEDDSRLVVVNREAASVTVFRVDLAEPGSPPKLERVAEVAVGREPAQVAIAPAGDRAFVVVRERGVLVRVDGLRDEPRVAAVADLEASEPTGLALSPTGRSVWVANWVEGTVRVVDAESMTVSATIDLNATLAKSGYLGAGIEARPALAHPRSIAITNDGDTDDDDETAYVTEYFGQLREPVLPDGSNADTARVGVLYKIPIATKVATTVALPPAADTGLRAHDGTPVGCFPNQLQSVRLHGGAAYITSVCASPRGPAGVVTGPSFATCRADEDCPGGAPGTCDGGRCVTNCTENAQCGVVAGQCTNFVCKPNEQNAKGLSSPAVSIVDLAKAEGLGTVALNAPFVSLYESLGVPDTSARRLPLVAMDTVFVPGTDAAYLPANGADAVFRIDVRREPAAVLAGVGHPASPFVDLAPPFLDPSRIGRLPIGVAVLHRAPPPAPQGESGAADRDVPQFAFVANEHTRNVQVIDLAKGTLAGVSDNQVVAARTSDLPTDPKALAVRDGKYLFQSGLGRWSLGGQAWGACQSCHIDGLTDNVTWFIFRGPRQSPSIDAAISRKNPGEYKILNWTAVFDELSDYEVGAVRNVFAGVGAIVRDRKTSGDSRIPFDRLGHAGLNGSSRAAANPANPANLPDACVVDEWEKVIAYMQTIRSPHKPRGLDASKVEAGRRVFEQAKCQGCHSGDNWTISRGFYAPDPTNATNRALTSLSWRSAVIESGFPQKVLPTQIESAQTMRYSGPNPAANDQITCVLRNVGTYGVAEPGVGIAELRANMTTPAQGNDPEGRGYNPPPLRNMVAGAPYFHAGNARTLEALLSPTFAGHHGAFAEGALDPSDPDARSKREALVQFLLSIDEQTETLPVPPLGPDGGDFCRAP